MAKQYDLGRVVGEAPIDDAAPSSTKVYSSQKTQNELDQLSQQIANAHRGILINNYFKDPVNQRGFTGGVLQNGQRCIDGWQAYSSQSSYQPLEVNLTEDGIRLSTGVNTSFTQFFPDVRKYFGKPMTLAVEFSDGTVFVGNGVTPDQPWKSIAPINNSDIYITGQTFDGNKGAFFIQLKKDLAIKWVDLFEGTYTAETIPMRRPYSKTNELIECQRRFRVYETESARPSKPLDCSPPMELASGTTALTQGTLTVDGKTLYYNSTEL